MVAYLLDAATGISCPHGGSGSAIAGATRVSLGGNPPLRTVDPVTITGCGFNVSGAPSPCVRVEWQLPATRVQVESAPVLLSSSVGLCMNVAGAPQGTAMLSGYQTKVAGL
jgi:hypothetical protein